MKKFLLCFFIAFMMITLSRVYANDINAIVSRQTVSVNGEIKNFEVYSISGYNYFKLRDIAYILNGTSSQFGVTFNEAKSLIEVYKSKPYVAVGGEMTVGEDKSSSAQSSHQKMEIDNNEVNFMAYLIGGNNFFKLRDLGTALDFFVDYDEPNDRVIIESKKKSTINLTSIAYQKIESTPCIVIKADAPIENYNVFSLDEPSRIIVDISNSKLPDMDKQNEVNDVNLSRFRLGDQGGNVSRVVLDLNSLVDYKLVLSDDKKTLYVATDKSFTLANDGQSPVAPNVPVIPEDIIINPEISSGDTSGEIIINPSTPPAKITSIKYSSTKNSIKISNTSKLEYSTNQHADSNIIEIDFENTILDFDGPTSIKPKNKNITEVTYNEIPGNKVRVTVHLENLAEYTIDTLSKSTEILFDERANLTYEYTAEETQSVFTIKNVKKGIFSITDSSRYNKYTMKYGTSKYKVTDEIIKVNDDFVNKIEVQSGKFIVYGQEDTIFKLRQVGSDVELTISKKSASKNNFVVLLDAGHGGKDPGACNGDDYEKVYNLEILLKVKELLEDTDGIEVRCSRTTDKYIDIEGRIGFVLDNDDANLLVSIHNNSLSNNKYQGSMVLFCNKPDEKEDYGITSKELATIVKDNIIANTGMIDRGVVSRDDLWILEQNASGKIDQRSGESRPITNLPAILCEVCFMSNDEELERLKTDEFQQDVADAIYEGIIEAKEIMED